MTATTYGSSTTTIVVLSPCGGDLPSDEPCEWHEMHHLDDQGRHWCPTGHMLCHAHFGVGTITGSGACNLWGEHPEEPTP